MRTTAEIRDEIESLRKQIAAVPRNHTDTESRIATMQTEDSICLSELAEISSNKFEKQTSFLIKLTWAILFLTVFAVIPNIYEFVKSLSK